MLTFGLNNLCCVSLNTAIKCLIFMVPGEKSHFPRLDWLLCCRVMVCFDAVGFENKDK